MRRLFLSCLLMMACGDQRPCSSCPDIAGAYLVSWQQGVAQMNCPSTGPRPLNFNLVLQGNRVSTLVGGDELRGTLYDTYDFSVSGGHADTTYTLRGRAVLGTAADGGAGTLPVHLVGSLFSRTNVASAGCELKEDYTADRL